MRKIYLDKTLGLHYHVPVRIVDQKFYSTHYFGKWVESLTPFFNKIVLVCYESEDPTLNYQISSKKVSVISLGEKPSGIFTRVINFIKKREQLCKKLNMIDMIGIRAPTPLAVPLLFFVRNKDCFLLLVGNMWRINQYSDRVWWKKFLIFVYWYCDHFLLSLMANKYLTFGNGTYFRKEFPLIKNLEVIFTSTISNEDIQIAPKTRKIGSTFNLIYSGRVSSDKGICSVIRAIPALNKRGVNICFTIMGGGDDEVSRIIGLSKELGVFNQIKMLGLVSEKTILRKNLLNADAMIVPSLWDFQPRSIWEGMSAGLPMLISRGIKSVEADFIHRQDICMFEPNNIIEIESELFELVTNKNLYGGLSRASLQIANRRTAEKSALLLVNRIADYLKQKI